VLLSLLVYGRATGVFSSRKLEWATYESVAFRFIAANDHPDHGTIATFRRRFLKEIEALLVKVLLLAREKGLLKMGTVVRSRRRVRTSLTIVADRLGETEPGSNAGRTRAPIAWACPPAPPRARRAGPPD